LQEIHAKMERELAKEGAKLVEVSACIHVPHAGCACRKPEAGMLLALAEKYEIDLASSYMIGDRDVDIQAGKRAGTLTILVGGAHHTLADYTADNLQEAVGIIERLSS
jgi:D-glycero-D-manno-heptose 1,7-bisphosphate phosphatase